VRTMRRKSATLALSIILRARARARIRGERDRRTLYTDTPMLRNAVNAPRGEAKCAQPAKSEARRAARRTL